MYLFPDRAPVAITAELFAMRTVSPEEIIDGVNAILPFDIRGIFTCAPDWVSATTYLEWAEKGLGIEGQYGWASAIANAKRAVCCRIDGLLLNRHLRAAMQRQYPEKLEILTSIGIRAPAIVHSYIIQPRNVEEHDYLPPDKDRAKVAVEMAQLFLAATKGEHSHCVVLLGDNLEPLLPHFPPFELDEAVCGGIPGDPFVFVDVFENSPKIKLVIPGDQEVLACELSSFSISQSIKLTNLLSNRDIQPPDGRPMTGGHFYRKDYLQRIKELAKL